MQVLSLGLRSIIGKIRTSAFSTESPSPAWKICCMKPDQFGTGSFSLLKSHAVCHRRFEYKTCGSTMFGHCSVRIGSNMIRLRAGVCGPANGQMCTPLPVTSSSVVTLAFRLMRLAMLVDRESAEYIAMVPIPWNVPSPVSVRMLWSALSLTHCVNF